MHFLNRIFLHRARLATTPEEELPKKIDLALHQHGESHTKLLELLHLVTRYSVKTGHPRFVNQLYSSVDPYGLVGQWLTDALNPSVYTYEVSPVFSLMEEVVLREMRQILGWPDQGQGDGIFCPGGSMANGYAINIARHHAYPEIKERGLSGLPRLVVFTSEDAHYSVKKLTAFLGMGASNVYSVKVDGAGQMRVDDLRAQIERAIGEGARPLLVSATAGTTVIGAFDPLREIAAVCREHKIWLHVDAAWAVALSYIPESKRHLEGEELSAALHKIAPIVKSRMVKEGSMLITYQPIRGQANFFRLVLQNSGLTEDDMLFIVQEIERLSKDL
ncbi:unnamed protein product [Trichogramma brassicae]|uniref:Uncharacterized protein n=1 Tax=Trichogramma brassicae TaxID=86971 RepID=A0A6H5IDG7_9HYME|nr:unnamed protein product [Trichogramma brassicae]